ncbi:MAG: VacJ family lipoprotein [Nitrospina sp.]|nr:VacJ family lipoprotein [Nitrospina sp.]
MVQTTEVTIQLEKKMPAMQGSSDKPFLGPDPMESDFEDDPFATPKEEVPPLDDPIEGFNRSVYKFNDTVYDNLLRPVAETYRDLVHEEVRIAIRNLFNNALAPVKLVSSVVQLDPEKAGRVVGRTLLNTIFGWGGMLDVAGQEYGIKDVNEDFNQALGYHGVGSGPYVVLPFLGPTTLRGVAGRVVDSFLSPTIVAAPGFAVGAALSGSRIVNDTSFRIEDIDALKKDAIDPYVSMRDFYHQYTEGQIKK